MNTDQNHGAGRFIGKHGETTDLVLRVFYEVYNELGSGFLESVYHTALAMALTQAGVQVAIPVHFRGVVVGDFRADLIVNGAMLLELKAAQTLDRTHQAQILHYLKATTLEVGMLINFGPKPQFRRFLLDNDQKKIRVHPCLSVVKALPLPEVV